MSPQVWHSTLLEIYSSPDAVQNCIRKLRPGGTITTVVGQGPFGFTGDGGPATRALLNYPNGVGVDASGNLYVLDTRNNRVRKIDSGGIITTVAGKGGEASGDGGLAISASLNGPSGFAIDSTGNLYIAELFSNRIRAILAVPPIFTSPTSGAISISAPSRGKPAAASISVLSSATTAAKSIAVPGMAHTVKVTSGEAWMSVSPQSGATPGLARISADPMSLPPGTYQGTVTITMPYANPSGRTVNIKFIVGQPEAANLSVDRSHLSFTYAKTSVARNQTINISNQGGGSLAFTTSVVLDSGQTANWLTVTPPSGTATPSSPVVLNVRADPSSLKPGAYTGHVTITGSIYRRYANVEVISHACAVLPWPNATNAASS